VLVEEVCFLLKMGLEKRSNLHFLHLGSKFVSVVKKADELGLPFPYKRKSGENKFSKKETLKHLKSFYFHLYFEIFI
jgi:hypothetical protein